MHSLQKICQNRLTHLCVAVVNHLGNSSIHQLDQNYEKKLETDH